MGKKHKKDKKKKKHSSKSKQRRRSSSSSSTSSEEWIKKDEPPKNASRPHEPSKIASRLDERKERDEWMSMENCFSGKTRKELNEGKKKEKDNSNERVNILDAPGQSARELNPFWKDGGTGLPSEHYDPKKSSTSRVGDKGAHFLRKALERAKEKAEEEGRSLEDVVAERWGSLDEFNKNLQNAEKNDQRQSYSRHDSRYSDRSRHRYDQDYNDSNKKRLNFRKPDEDSGYTRNDYRSYESKSSRPNWKKPSSDNHDARNRSSEDHERRKSSHHLDSRKSPSNSGETRNQSSDREVRKQSSDFHEARKSSSESFEVRASDRVEQKNQGNRQDVMVISDQEENSRSPINGVGEIDDEQILSINELNHLFASSLRAELAGNMKLAKQLQMEAKFQKHKRINALENKQIYDDNADRVVILMETDNRGFTRPVKSLEGSNSRKRKVETHADQKRVRYFADDDKYSLQDMFEREKYNSTEDDQKMFLKLSAQRRGSGSDDEGAFDKARMDESGADENKKRSRMIRQHVAQEKAVENCRWCIGSRAIMDECIVLSKSKVYVAAPTSQSLTERHCLIIPFSHIPSATLLDEDEWAEIMELRKKIVAKLLEDDEDVIFFEIASNFHKHPHMVLHCVPVPKEIGDSAPIYFKKAMLECEAEWSNNKKVVDLAGRDVRKAVPKGLPYFAVDFGMQSGYAHVIEDKRLFPTNFGQEVIGGMMDLDHTIWRKQRSDSTENISKKVKLLKQLFEEDT